MGGTGGGGDAMVGLAGGDRYGTANERVRLWVRLKLDPDGEEGAKLLGVGGAETTDLDALFGV
jgi:ABC-type tungstate transport system permease subunit